MVTRYYQWLTRSAAQAGATFPQPRGCSTHNDVSERSVDQQGVSQTTPVITSASRLVPYTGTNHAHAYFVEHSAWLQPERHSSTQRTL